jgi:hypothetical protein
MIYQKARDPISTRISSVSKLIKFLFLISVCAASPLNAQDESEPVSEKPPKSWWVPDRHSYGTFPFCIMSDSGGGRKEGKYRRYCQFHGSAIWNPSEFTFVRTTLSVLPGSYLESETPEVDTHIYHTIVALSAVYGVMTPTLGSVFLEFGIGPHYGYLTQKTQLEKHTEDKDEDWEVLERRRSHRNFGGLKIYLSPRYKFDIANFFDLGLVWEYYQELNGTKSAGETIFPFPSLEISLQF